MPSTPQTLSCTRCATPFEYTEDEHRFEMLRSMTGRPTLCARCRGAELDKKVPGYSFPFLCVGCNVASRTRFQPRGAVKMYCEQCLLVQLRAVTFEPLPDARWAGVGSAGRGRSAGSAF